MTVPTAAMDETQRFDIIPFKDLSPEETWTRIGGGSFGQVFKGEYLGLEVAIKEVLDSSDYDVSKYFNREIKILQEARHPNVLQYIGLTLAPSAPEPAEPVVESDTTSSIGSSVAPTRNGKHRERRILIISEFLPGGNVRNYIADATLPFPWRHRLSFAIDIARAIAYMHKRNCMHRDLKGENLLITDNQRIKVCDFGFARIAPRNQAEMLRMSYCGTDGYMSPEIIQGLEFDLRTDIFSFGVILAEILCRTLADGEVFRRYAPEFGLDVDEIADRASPGCPRPLIDLAMSCCATDPTDRPAILDIVAVLRQIERDLVLAERQSTQTVTHVGTLRFRAAGTAASRQSKRPTIGRIPSFKGQVQVPRRSSSHSSSASTSSEDVEVAMAREGLQGVGIVDDQGRREPEEPWLEDEPRSPAKDANGATPSYSTAVFRASKLKSHSSLTQSSSVLTIKARPRPIDRDDGLDSDSLPSIPSAWIRESAAAQAREAELAAEQAQAPAAPESHTATPSVLGSIATFLTARTTTPSIAAATINAPIGVNDEAPTIILPMGETTQTMELPLDGFLHRFSLVKPAWLRLFWGMSDHGGATCECCRKRFGLRKEYFQCDDCGFKSHPKCADAAPADCHAGVSLALSPSLSSDAPAASRGSLSPSVVPSKMGGIAKLRRRSYGRTSS